MYDVTKPPSLASDLQNVNRRVEALEAGGTGGGGDGGGGIGPPGPQGPEGPQGPQGEPGTPGSGGDFDGEHVLTGDPDSPPEDWAVGQLLYDGVEDAGGGVGSKGDKGDPGKDGEDGLPGADGKDGKDGLPGADGKDGADAGDSPHDHDYLPLTGGTLTGDLTVDGHVTTGAGRAVYFGGNWDGGRIYNSGSGTREYMVLGRGDTGAQINLYGMNDDKSLGNILFYAGEEQGGGARTVGRWDGPTGAFIAYRDVEVRGDLQVDGTLNAQGGGHVLSGGSQVLRIDGATDADRPYVAWLYQGERAGYVGYPDSTSFRIVADNGRRVLLDGTDVRVATDLQVDGKATISDHIALPNARSSDVAVTAAPNLYVTSGGNVRYTTFSAAPKAFNIADGIDTADVLDRAEVATMPAPDAEGVATADVEAESLTVNEVVTALLLKVKELSAEIEELKGN